MERTLHTTCTMDCPDSCQLAVTVDGDQVRSIRGATEHPTTNGFICSKVANFARRVDHESRVLYPMARRGPKGSGEFSRISWDEAIAEITHRFQYIKRTWGGEAILPYHYGGSNGFLGDGLLDNLYFARLGASRQARTLCAAVTGEVANGMYGKMPGVAFNDYPRAKCIVIWGANPKASNIHLVPFLQQAKKNGAFIAVIDPKRNFSAKEIDVYLPILPGTDLPVALSMIRWWEETGKIDRPFINEYTTGADTLLDAAREWTFEKAASVAGVEAGEIARLAEKIAELSPAVVRCGWGIERNSNGGQAVAAVLAIPSLLGKFGVRGGGYTMSNSAAAPFDATKVIGKFDWNTRVLNQSQLGDILFETLDPVKGLFVYNCNPAVTAPDQNRVVRGLMREDLFTVVFEQVMTDTARYADIVLPAVTFLEQWELKRGYGSYMVGGVRPVIQPRGEARSNEEVFAELGRAAGFADEPFNWNTEQLMERSAAALRLGSRQPDMAALREGGIERYDFPGETPIQFATVFPGTPDGKIHLTPAALGPQPYRHNDIGDALFPLALITPSNQKMISSTMGEYNYPELMLDIHPADAGRRSIAEGDPVRVFNALGEVRCRATVSTKVRPGVVSMPKGAWMKSSLNGSTPTALCPSNVNVVGGGACFNDARVEVEKIES